MGRDAGIDRAVHLAELVGPGRHGLRAGGALAEVRLHDLAAGRLEGRRVGLPSVVEIALDRQAGGRGACGSHQVEDSAVAGRSLEVQDSAVQGIALAIVGATQPGSACRDRGLDLPEDPHGGDPPS